MTKKYKFLFHNIIAAPFDGFYEMRRMNKGNVWFVVLMYGLYVLLQIIALATMLIDYIALLIL